MNKGQMICVRPKNTRINNHSTQHTPLQHEALQNLDFPNALPTESHRKPWFSKHSHNRKSYKGLVFRTLWQQKVMHSFGLPNVWHREVIPNIVVPKVSASDTSPSYIKGTLFAHRNCEWYTHSQNFWIILTILCRPNSPYIYVVFVLLSCYFISCNINILHNLTAWKTIHNIQIYLKHCIRFLVGTMWPIMDCPFLLSLRYSLAFTYNCLWFFGFDFDFVYYRKSVCLSITTDRCLEGSR